ncbi:MAG: chemotaxis protein CheB [Singulisphaera sp.]
MIIAQDEKTSVVFGMPGTAVAAGLADAVLPLDAIAPDREGSRGRRAVIGVPIRSRPPTPRPDGSTPDAHRPVLQGERMPCVLVIEDSPLRRSNWRRSWRTPASTSRRCSTPSRPTLPGAGSTWS